MYLQKSPCHIPKLHPHEKKTRATYFTNPKQLEPPGGTEPQHLTFSLLHLLQALSSCICSSSECSTIPRISRNLCGSLTPAILTNPIPLCAISHTPVRPSAPKLTGKQSPTWQVSPDTCTGAGAGRSVEKEGGREEGELHNEKSGLMLRREVLCATNEHATNAWPQNLHCYRTPTEAVACCYNWKD